MALQEAVFCILTLFTSLMKQRHADLHSLESVTVGMVIYNHCSMEGEVLGAPHTRTDQCCSLYYNISHKLQLSYTLLVKITDGPTGQWLTVEFAADENISCPGLN